MPAINCFGMKLLLYYSMLDIVFDDL